MAGTIIQQDLVVDGNLSSKDGLISISGKVTGDIDAKSIEVLAQGVVEGGLSAEDVKIAGSLKGRVKCKALDLAENSEVQADVTAGTMTMSSGAKISGRVEARGG